MSKVDGMKIVSITYKNPCPYNVDYDQNAELGKFAIVVSQELYEAMTDARALDKASRELLKCEVGEFIVDAFHSKVKAAYDAADKLFLGGDDCEVRRHSGFDHWSEIDWVFDCKQEFTPFNAK